jgi:nucleoside-diphosphate-sugar epimerase
MKILITGGSGFLGINLIRFLQARGYKDLVILDFADFTYPEHDSITFIKGDIRDRNYVSKALHGIDWVIHCAAALPSYKANDIYTTDIDGTRILLEESLKLPIKRFVHISSTAVFGIPDHAPLLEDDPLIPVGPYGIAKIKAEEICLEYRKKDMIIPIIRPVTFIGPERLGVWSLLYDWAKEGHNFPLIGNGKNRYQLLDVEDLCEVILLCLTKDEKNANDTFNVGSDRFTTMKEDYQAVLDYAGKGKKVIPFPSAPVIWTLRFLEFLKLSPVYKWVYEIANRNCFVNSERAKTKLGFSPKYSNKETLVRNYNWYCQNLESFSNASGVSHRVPWKQGILSLVKVLF